VLPLNAREELPSRELAAVCQVGVAVRVPGVSAVFPNVTYWLVPLNCKAVPAGAAETEVKSRPTVDKSITTIRNTFPSPENHLLIFDFLCIIPPQTRPWRIKKNYMKRATSPGLLGMLYSTVIAIPVFLFIPSKKEEFLTS
jgi:hypothetical protein